MSCASKRCPRKGVDGVAHMVCICGEARFCSEACWITAWHAGHRDSCTHSREILAAASQIPTTPKSTTPRGSRRKGTALLVQFALKAGAPPSARSSPQHGATEAGAPLTSADTPFGSRQTADSTSSTASSRHGVHSAGKHPGRAEVCEEETRVFETTVMPSPSSSSSSTAPVSTEPVAPAVAACQPPSKREFADFDFLGELGSGGCGTVSKVAERQSGTVYALKVIDRSRGPGAHPGLLKYIEREVRLQLALRHPDIVHLHEYFEDGQHVCLLLEFAPNGSLFSRIRKQGRLSDAEASKVFCCVLRALEHLHRNGVAHRDLKPENVLLFSEGSAKLADFGWCAEVLHGEEAARQTFCGTPDYLSPEMVTQRPHDHRVDLWAAGVLLFEMLAGKAPFKASAPAELFRRILEGNFVLPDDLRPESQNLIRGLLRERPEDRLPVAEALRHPWLQPARTRAGDSAQASAKVCSNMEQSLAAAPTPSRGMGGASPFSVPDSARSKLLVNSFQRLDSARSCLNSARSPRQHRGLEQPAAHLRRLAQLEDEEDQASESSSTQDRSSGGGAARHDLASSQQDEPKLMAPPPSRSRVPQIGGLESLECLLAPSPSACSARGVSSSQGAARFKNHAQGCSGSGCSSASTASGSSFVFQAALRPAGRWDGIVDSRKPSAEATSLGTHANADAADEFAAAPFSSRENFLLQTCLTPLTGLSYVRPRAVTDDPPTRTAPGRDWKSSSGRSWRETEGFTAVRSWVRPETPREMAEHLDKVIRSPTIIQE